ncbi:hypothetical protein B0H13DRAFT_2448258 [Mycena leptocephala]|nr:hypothetical protein B0H13DRAFT_2448258 [Mycena leptocephala]
MTLGGSRFSGALGGMLIEILPFLRGMASDIRGVLGDDHPGLIPTVMAAYALTSFLTGAAFLILGLLKIGNLVWLPFPPSATPLSLSNVTSTLFDTHHHGLLAASFFPAFVLSVTLRSRHMELWTRGLTRSPYYIPLYLLVIPSIFWIVVRSIGVPIKHLVAAGWLFQVDTVSSPSALVAGWNYWTLFDFRLVEWWALKSAIQNLVLLVVIGVLNLPIYVPTLAFTLDVSYDMNYELLGQAAGNILAGLVGTIPNILQYSYSVYASRAKAGRFELSIVIVLMAVLFLCSGLIMPYVPTVLASVLVLFIGIELFLEAIWEASKTLAWMEYAVVVATLAACTFLGFAEGFGVGIGAATVVYFMYGVMDSVRTFSANELAHTAAGEEPGRGPRCGTARRAAALAAQLHPAAITLGTHQSGALLTVDLKPDADTDLLHKLNARVLVLPGYIFFASVPSLERALLGSDIPVAFFILDLGRAHRIETAAARSLLRCVRELQLKNSVLVVCGVRQNGGLYADFERAEVTLVFNSTAAVEGKGIPAFETRDACLAWCQTEQESRANKVEGLDDETKESAFKSFCRLFDFEPSTVLDSPETADCGSTEVARFVQAGGRIIVCLPGQELQNTGITFVVEGQIDCIATPPSTNPGVLRPSVHRLLTMLPRETLRMVQVRLPIFSRAEPTHVRCFKPGGVLDGCERSGITRARTRSIVVEMEGEKLMAWAQARLNEQTGGA